MDLYCEPNGFVSNVAFLVIQTLERPLIPAVQ
jgi:hypothetical protein